MEHKRTSMINITLDREEYVEIETMTPSGGPSHGAGQCRQCGRTRGSHHTMDCQSSGCDGR